MKGQGPGAACATAVLRWLPAAASLAYSLGLWDADAWLGGFWDAVGGTAFAQRPLAEAYVASFSFAGWMVLFSIADLFPQLEASRMAKFASDAKPAHTVLAVVAAISGTFLAVGEPFGREVPLAAMLVLLVSMHFAGTYRLLHEVPGMLSYAVRIYATFFVYLGAIALLHAFKDPRPADTGPIGFLRFVIELAFGVVAYDFVFSWIHVGMHKLGARFFCDHHQHHVVSGFWGRVLAFDTVNIGLIDGSLQVLTNIMVQNIGICGLPKHKLSRLVHNILVTGLLVESHAGYDGFWSTHNLYPRIFGGAKRHVPHHTHGAKHFQQFFCYLDDTIFRYMGA